MWSYMVPKVPASMYSCPNSVMPSSVRAGGVEPSTLILAEENKPIFPGATCGNGDRDSKLAPFLQLRGVA